jgi:hypothetical protein
MEIKTKYNIDDEVWFYIGSEVPIKCKITGIKVEVSSTEEKVAGEKRDLIKTGKHIPNNPTFSYDIKFRTHPFQHPSVSERYLYSSKEELKEKMINRINNF